MFPSAIQLKEKTSHINLQIPEVLKYIYSDLRRSQNSDFKINVSYKIHTNTNISHTPDLLRNIYKVCNYVTVIFLACSLSILSCP
jgi:hypothetical protein